MITAWTSEDIDAILGQLDSQKLPFSKHAFSRSGGKLVWLGSGATANVYKAETRKNKKGGFAIKVIGFGDKQLDAENFVKTVKAQESLSISSDNIVKIIEVSVIKVWIEGDNTVTNTSMVELDSLTSSEAEKKDKKDSNNALSNCLHLQFILMEEVMPILTSNGTERPFIALNKLSNFDEKEILELAYDIGTALEKAHGDNLIHRDIKLENIFYDPASKNYKLGDFGVARVMDYGFASTTAFTKGYGAPEVVGSIEDKYDCTADIYSFGMVLYVLLNELRFPDSTNYHPNIRQYSKNFEAEYPVGGSDEFCRIVLKMISYDPDDRYQSMEEVMNELNGLKYGRRIRYQIEHKASSLIMGTLLGLLGAAFFEIIINPVFISRLSLVAVLFWGSFTVKTVLHLQKKNHLLMDIIAVILGLYLIFSSGFTLWKLLGLIFLEFFAETLAGVIGAELMLMKLCSLLVLLSGGFGLGMYTWVSIICLTLSALLLFYNFIISLKDESMIKMYLGKNFYWVLCTIVFLCIALLGGATNVQEGWLFDFWNRIFRGNLVNIIMGYDIIYFGVSGMAFCIFWMVRDFIMANFEKYMQKISNN